MNGQLQHLLMSFVTILSGIYWFSGVFSLIVIVISSTKYSWRPVSAGVPQRLIVGPVLVNICINNVSDERVQLQQIAGGAKPGGVVDTPEGCGGSGDTFLRTWKAGGRTGPAWASRSSWHEEPNPSSRMGWGLTSWTERHLCMLEDTRWNRRQWGVASEASSLLCCIRSVASSWKGGPSSLLSTDKATSLGSPVQER